MRAPSIDAEKYSRIFGRAAARAYVGYKNPTFLDYAVQSWWFGRAYTISPADAASGSISTKDFPIWEVCDNGEAIPTSSYKCVEVKD